MTVSEYIIKGWSRNQAQSTDGLQKTIGDDTSLKLLKYLAQQNKMQVKHPLNKRAKKQLSKTAPNRFIEAPLVFEPVPRENEKLAVEITGPSSREIELAERANANKKLRKTEEIALPFDRGDGRKPPSRFSRLLILANRSQMLVLPCMMTAFAAMILTIINKNLTSGYADTALKALDSNKLQVAKSNYSAALKLDPHNTAVILAAGKLAEKENRLQDAYKEYQRGLLLAPDSKVLLDHLGALALKLGKYKEAISAYDRLFELEGTKLAGHQVGNRAIAYSSSGMHKQALFDYLVYNRIEPDNKVALSGIAYSLSQLGRYEEALEKLNLLLETDPKDYENRLLRGWCLKSLGKNSEAQEDFIYVIQSDKSNARAHNYLADMLIEEKKFDEAIKNLKISLELQPDNASAQLSLARASLYVNQFNEAFMAYQKAIGLGLELDLVNGEGYALAAMKAGKSHEAQKTLTRLIEKHANYLPLYILQAEVANSLKEHKDALRNCDLVLARQPDSIEAHRQRAIALEGIGDKSQAASAFIRVIELAPHSSQDKLTYADFLSKTGRFDEASEYYAKVLAKSPGNERARKGNEEARRMLLARAKSDRDELRELNLRLAKMDQSSLLESGIDAMRKGKVSEAKAALTLAVKKQPDSVDARRYLVRTLLVSGKAGDADAAEKQLQELKKLGNTEPGDTRNLAKAFMKEKKFSRAKQILEEHLAKNKSDIAAIISLSDTYLALGDTITAVSICSRALSESKNAPDYNKLEQYYKTMKASLARARTRTVPARKEIDKQNFADTAG